MIVMMPLYLLNKVVIDVTAIKMLTIKIFISL